MYFPPILVKNAPERSFQRLIITSRIIEFVPTLAEKSFTAVSGPAVVKLNTGTH